MTYTAHLRWPHLATALLCLAVPCIGSAQALPPSTATRFVPSPAQTPSQPPSSSQFVQGNSAPPPASRAQVKLTSGLLSISAQNASLNEVLREIGRVTGMRITGTIADERVFGNYGPAAPQEVLSQLLEGTGTNILLHEDAQHAVRELTLTARQGTATPPGATPSSSTPAAGRNEGEGNLRSQLLERRRHMAENQPDGSDAQGNSRPETQPVFPQPQNPQPPANGLSEPQQRQLQQHLGPQQEPPEQ